MVDRDYFNYIFNNVDKEVMVSHTEEKNRGRANVLVMRTEYKGQYIDFAIPEIGDVSQRKFEERDFVGLSAQKVNGNGTSGFAVSKLMPVESSLIIPFNFSNSPIFRQIAVEITKKEPELIAKTKAHLVRLEVGEKVKFSTNVDKQLKFLNARTELLNQGYKEEDIYRENFKTNLGKANTLKNVRQEKPQVKSIKGVELLKE